MSTIPAQCVQYLTFKSPEMLAPASIPVAAGKNMANTEKKSSPSLKSGPKLLTNASTEIITINTLQFILILFRSIVKQAVFTKKNHEQIHSWKQPVLSNEGKVSCSRKKRGPLIGSKLTPLQLFTDNESDKLTPALSLPS